MRRFASRNPIVASLAVTHGEAAEFRRGNSGCRTTSSSGPDVQSAPYRLDLSHSTVRRHLTNARSLVGAVTTAQLVWILAQRLPEPEGGARTDE